MNEGLQLLSLPITTDWRLGRRNEARSIRLAAHFDTVRFVSSRVRINKCGIWVFFLCLVISAARSVCFWRGCLVRLCRQGAASPSSRCQSQRFDDGRQWRTLSGGDRASVSSLLSLNSVLLLNIKYMIQIHQELNNNVWITQMNQATELNEPIHLNYYHKKGLSEFIIIYNRAFNGCV